MIQMLSKCKTILTDWITAFSIYRNKKVIILFFLGFSSGLPLPLIFSSLSFWLREAGIDRATIGFLSWIGLSYAFKWVWAPLMDRCYLPILSKKLGRRRSWLLFSQLGILFFLFSISRMDPTTNLLPLVYCVFGLALSSATQDIMIDAYRIDSGSTNLQAAMAATYQIGYRIAMIVSGAGVLAIAAIFSDSSYDVYGWQIAYLFMILFASIGIFTTLIAPEPKNSMTIKIKPNNIHWLKRLPLWFNEVFIEPFIDFFIRYRWIGLLLLLLIGTYRISDITLGVMANPFYYDTGFTKEEVASITKIYGVFMTLIGATIGGVFIHRFGIMKILFLGALFSATSNLLFAWLHHIGHSISWLIIVISIDNFSGGLASSAFVAWLSSLTNISYSATQYALFSSVMLIIPKFIAGFSGLVVDHIGYSWFFISTAIIGMPVLLLIILASRYLKIKNIT